MSRTAPGPPKAGLRGGVPEPGAASPSRAGSRGSFPALKDVSCCPLLTSDRRTRAETGFPPPGASSPHPCYWENGGAVSPPWAQGCAPGLGLLQVENPVPWPVLSELWSGHRHALRGLCAAQPRPGCGGGGGSLRGSGAASGQRPLCHHRLHLPVACQLLDTGKRWGWGWGHVGPGS